MNRKEEYQREFEIMRKNFKIIREKQGLSIEYLSDISGIEIKTLIDIETGEDFDYRCIFKLCRLYNIKPQDIFKELTW